MSDVALANEPEARTPTGEIKDQTPSTPPTTETPKTSETSPTTPSTTTEDKPSLANEKKAEEAKPVGAPEKYEAWKVPDGSEMPETVTKSVNELFKELNLSQEHGQKLVDFQIKMNQEAAEAPFKLWQDTQEKWRNEVKLDPEIGPKLDQVRTTISKAIDGMGTPELATAFRAAMDYTGAGNNLAFIKTFYKIAQMVTEGGHVAGQQPSKFGQLAPNVPERPTAAKAMYPNLP